MTEQTAVAVETPRRRIRVKLPSRQTVTKVGALAGAATLGYVAGKRKLAAACACESDSAEHTDQTDN